MADETDQEDTRPLARLKSRPQVRNRLAEIKAYIDEQRGNDPEDLTGWKVLQRIFHDLFEIRRWPYISPQIQGMSYLYRKRRVGSSYMLYYFVDEAANTIFLIDLRHGSRRPLKPSTIRKYKEAVTED